MARLRLMTPGRGHLSIHGDLAVGASRWRGGRLSFDRPRRDRRLRVRACRVPFLGLERHGEGTHHLLATVGAALRFDVPEDPESVQLQQLLRSLSPVDATSRITGLNPEEPLYDQVRDIILVAGAR